MVWLRTKVILHHVTGVIFVLTSLLPRGNTKYSSSVRVAQDVSRHGLPWGVAHVFCTLGS